MTIAMRGTPAGAGAVTAATGETGGAVAGGRVDTGRGRGVGDFTAGGPGEGGGAPGRVLM